MANFMDTIKAALDKTDLSKAADSATSKITSMVTGAASAAGQLTTLQDDIKKGVDEVAAEAKIYAVTTISLQAIAAFAALGIFVIQWRAYTDAKPARKVVYMSRPRMATPRRIRSTGRFARRSR